MLDPYLSGNSLVHCLDGRIKLLLTLAFILTVSLLPNAAWAAFILLQSILIASVILAEMSFGVLLRRSWLALPFVLAAMPLLFTLPGPSLAEINLGRLTLTASTSGLARFLTIAVRSFLSVQAAVILTASTLVSRLLVSMRALGVPRFLAAILGLMGRYLFLMADNAVRLVHARAARSTVSPRSDLKPGGSLTWRARVTGGMAGRLLLGSLERADRVYAAMLARGYDGEVRDSPAAKPGSTAWLVLAGMLILFLLILLFGWLIST